MSNLPTAIAISRARWLLRIGLAAVFGYAAIAATIAPDNWVGYLPSALRRLLPARELLVGFSLFELGLVVWLLSAWRTRWAALATAAATVGIVFTNIGILDITFRDITIVFAALALAVLAG